MIRQKPLFRALPLLVLAFYLLTLAPTVLWGDDAFFQRSAYAGILQADGGGHWLWYILARMLVQIPLGAAAYKVNLLSALAATVTVVVLYRAAVAIGLSPAAALITAGGTAVAHTFWMHAVRAEVYTVFTALLAVELLLLFSWTAKKFWPLPAALALFGLTLLGHQMAVLLLPMFGYTVWAHRARLSPRRWSILLGAFAAGLLPAALIIQNQIGAPTWMDSFLLYFTRQGTDFSGALFDFALAKAPRDAALWLAYLILQFPSPALLLGLFGFAAIRRQREAEKWTAVVVLYLTGVFFAFSYRVNDAYVFYLPSYIAFALLAGLGWDAARGRWQLLQRDRVVWTAVGLVLLLPLLAYLTAAGLFRSLELNPLGIRELPFREPNTYFLWPAKNGYRGAEQFGATLLTDLPAGSTLLADHTPYQTLLYLQAVENMRADVRLIFVGPNDDLQALVNDQPADSAIFFADDDPRYYDFAGLPGYELVPQGLAYQLVRPESAARMEIAVSP